MPQKGIFKGEEINNAALFQEFNIPDGANLIAIKENLRTIGLLNSESLSIIVAFSRTGLEKLNGELPGGLVDFETITGLKNLKMPSTQNEILIWAHSESKSEIFDFSLQINYLLGDALETAIKQEGFKYKDARDIMGFVDGSANPKVDERKEIALIDKGQDHENGSFVLTQKWIHNLKKFHANEVSEQERIIGRTKLESIELRGKAMPNNSHVSRTDVKVDGEAIKIFRRSYPFANEKEHGLFFLSFAKDITRFEIQLRRMLGATDDGITDRIMDFSVPITGSYFFAPSEKALIQLLGEGKLNSA